MLNRLSWLERANVRFVRASFEIRWLNGLLRRLQRQVGARWIRFCTDRLVTVVGAERLPPPTDERAIVWASNHRSFFDMYVANADMFRRGYHERVLFPVRSTFFYDHPLGFFVNGIMSFWSMYPPIFRERKRAALNHTAFSELAAAVRRGRSVGIHPEGTRNKTDDPYQLLPAGSGVGRLIHLARAPVVPIFIHGLGNELWPQIRGNFDGTGDRILLVYGAPVPLDDLLDAPPTSQTYRAIADRVMAAIAALGEEERRLRAERPEWAIGTPPAPVQAEGQNGGSNDED